MPFSEAPAEIKHWAMEIWDNLPHDEMKKYKEMKIVQDKKGNWKILGMLKKGRGWRTIART